MAEVAVSPADMGSRQRGLNSLGGSPLETGLGGFTFQSLPPSPPPGLPAFYGQEGRGLVVSF